MLMSAPRALEFDRVVDAIRRFALTPMGDERLARLAPTSEPHKVAELLAATTEAARFVREHGTLPLGAPPDLLRILGALAIEGRALEPQHLVALAGFLESVASARGAIRAAASFPRLAAMCAEAASFSSEIERTRKAVDASGEVVDEASPALKEIRERLRKQRGRLRGTLESYLRGRETAKYLQDQVVTERNGRYVLVVKAEQRANIPGIVHGASTSGASVYLEPLSTVEINNDIVALQEQEWEEVRRILLALTNLFRARALDVQRTVEAATELDVVQARARLSEVMDAVEPQLTTDGSLELLAARHPLLMPGVVRLIGGEDSPAGGDGHPSSGPVPVTIRLLPPATALLITGPNTGGKTVALKTAGLLCLMTQAGLRIPVADGSRVPVFRSIFADVGDEQSIEASLSTFSAHIANIVAMDRSVAPPSLILLDEVGSGTDPVEGGALGVAIIERLRARGARVVATSHYDALKTYASTTDGVTCAAFGFDPQSYAPTYTLVYGPPGRSLALEIAARLGLDPSVIEAARRNVSEREAQLAEHLARIDRDMRALEHEHRLLARERETIKDVEGRLRQRDDALKMREETFRRRLNEELDGEVRQARREIDAVIASLKAKTDRLSQDAARHVVSTGDTGSVRAEARAAVDAVARRLMEPAAAEAAPAGAGSARPPSVGDRVVVSSLGLEGTLLTVHDDAAEVDVRGKRMRTSLKELSVVAGPGPAAPRVKVHVELQPRESTPADLNVIGCTVDEAIARAERFLDQSLLGDQRVVRFIHGYGTGQLKRALAGFLQRHPLVLRFEAAPPEQGGGGVTVVELKD
jgi:DNA mismatch repair protein MutS2